MYKKLRVGVIRLASSSPFLSLSDSVSVSLFVLFRHADENSCSIMTISIAVRLNPATFRANFTKCLCGQGGQRVQRGPFSEISDQAVMLIL